jgi:hypothetical protein
MTMLLDRRGGGGYGADHMEEWPSKLPRLNNDLVGVGAERAGACIGRMASSINHNLRIKTIFSTKLLKISSFSERLNAIILIVYTRFFTFVKISIFDIALNCFKQIPLGVNLLAYERPLKTGI